MKDKIVRINQVCERLGISTCTLWRWRRAGQFPEPVSLRGSSIKAWKSSAIDEWIDQNFSTFEERN